MRPHYSGLWEHKLLPGFVWSSENMQSTLHWLFPHPYGDPTHKRLNQYSAKDFWEPLCISSELSFSLYGAPSSNMCFTNSVLQSSVFWSVLFTQKDFRALFWFQLLVLQLEICLQEVNQGNYTALLLCFPSPRGHCLLSLWSNIKNKFLTYFT